MRALQARASSTTLLVVLLTAVIFGSGAGWMWAAGPQTEPVPWLGRLRETRSRKTGMRVRMGYALPGRDGWTSEKYAREIGERLRGLSTALGERPLSRAALAPFFAPEFRGTPLKPKSRRLLRTQAPLVEHLEPETEPSSTAEMFPSQLAVWLGDYHTLDRIVFEVVSITLGEGEPTRAHTRVLYELAGPTVTGARRQQEGQWKLEWERSGEGVWQLLELRAGPARLVQSSQVHFTDVTGSALERGPGVRQLARGVEDWLGQLDATIGSDQAGYQGIAVADYDGDGWEDFYVAQPAGLPNRLFHNNGDGTFAEVAAAAGVDLLDDTRAALFFDFDNDGDADLLLVGQHGPALLRNDGAGNFAPADSQRIGFAKPGQVSPDLLSACVADYDGDGWLDFYVTATYLQFAERLDAVHPTPYFDAQNGPPNILYRNNGDGTFSEATSDASLNQNNNRFSHACAWGDYDQDGDPDLYVANGFGRNNLYRNQKGVFEDLAAEAGAEGQGDSTSAVWADFDNDGWLDLFAGELWSSAGQRVAQQPAFQAGMSETAKEQYRRSAGGNSLLRNRGDGTFEEVGRQTGVPRAGRAWGAGFLDADADGKEDLLVLNGFLTNESSADLESYFWRQVAANSPETGEVSAEYEESWRALNRLVEEGGSLSRRQANRFFLNLGEGGWADASVVLGLSRVEDGRAFASLDWDQDGDLDLVIKNRNGPQLVLLRNDSRPYNRALEFHLVGREGNRDAVGARVTLSTSRGRRQKSVQIGSGFLSQTSPRLYFGLGAEEELLDLVVEWPGGLEQRYRLPPVNHLVTLLEGETEWRAQPFAVREAALSAAVGAVAAPGARKEMWLVEPVPAAALAGVDLEGKPVALERWLGRPLLLHFWSTDCAHCQEALGEWAAAYEDIRRAGAELAGVTVEEPGRMDEARQFALERSLPFVTVLPDPASLYLYNVLFRSLPARGRDLEVPSSVLIDPEGRVVKLYWGATPPGRLLEDLQALASPAEKRSTWALPFPGRQLRPFPSRDYVGLAAAYIDAGAAQEVPGYLQRALVSLKQQAESRPDKARVQLYLGILRLLSGEAREGLENLKRAVQLAPASAEAQFNLALAYGRLGQPKKMLAAFERTVELDPAFAEAYFSLAVAYSQAGRPERSVETLEKLVRLIPEDAEAHNQLGLVLLALERDREALRSFERAVELAPGNPEAVRHLGMTSFKLGQLFLAIEQLERARQLGGEDIDTNMILAVAYYRVGRLEEAIPLVERVLELDPQDEGARELLDELKRLSGSGSP